MADETNFEALQVTSWNGGPTTILPPNGLSMPQTPNGSLVLAYQNRAEQDNQGQLMLTSGGGAPEPLEAQPFAALPQMLVQNWQADNLNLTNTSPDAATPIWVEASGPGLPGQIPLSFHTGTPLMLSPAQSAQTVAQPQWMQLMATATTASSAVVAIVGGPVDADGNNAYVIALNATSNTGSGTGAPPPSGYYATTTGNTYNFTFNWGASSIFVVNLSPSSAATAMVTLMAL